MCQLISRDRTALFPIAVLLYLRRTNLVMGDANHDITE